MIAALSHEGAFREAGLGITCLAAVLVQTIEAQIGRIGAQTTHGVAIAIGAQSTVRSIGAEALLEPGMEGTHVHTEEGAMRIIGTAEAGLRCHVAAGAGNPFIGTRDILGTTFHPQGLVAEQPICGRER